MKHTDHILVYGRSSVVLETRRMVLETTGATVFATTQWDEAQRVMNDPDLALMVLCYTLSAEDRSSILQSAERFHPRMTTLILRADGQSYPDFGKDTLAVFAGTRAFKAKVVELLQRERSGYRETEHTGGSAPEAI